MTDKLNVSRAARKKSEAALMESENRFRTLFKSATDAIFLIKDGKFVDCNPAALSLFGCSRDEIIGHLPAEFSPPKQPDGGDSAQKVIENDRLAYSGKPQRFYWQHKRLDGALVDAEVSLNALELSSGLHLQAIARDITAQKEAEEIIQRDKKALEKLVKEQTDELIEAQKKMASLQRLSDIGALAATVAHELRNPLGVIKTAIFNAKRKRKNRDVDKHLDNIDKKISESERIIRNLLSYSMIKTPRLEKTQFLSFVDETIRYLQEKYPKYKVTINLKHNLKKGDIIIADPLHLNELLSNILDNAYQSFPEKAGKIDIKIDYDEKEKKVRFWIKDDGKGITEQDLQSVFEPFFTKKTKGIGLGLTVCKQILDLHGGEISIESQGEAGTMVFVSLPWEKADKAK